MRCFSNRLTFMIGFIIKIYFLVPYISDYMHPDRSEFLKLDSYAKILYLNSKCECKKREEKILTKQNGNFTAYFHDRFTIGS
jgi:hypothetical protein